ncbi:hypothetical protein [Frigoribacterium sp. SL97]|uniref:hypothetical protein n=1 Tax=Frigoribacterium sp. SL97 TaxID=2994664 RepID=UPI00226FFE0A|nr:hypothetical protein [Frigoribacterium sp. SL97]WAC50535.1 hypothetical protein OVA02_11695 [Frigoribacterium sp. SL97]
MLGLSTAALGAAVAGGLIGAEVNGALADGGKEAAASLRAAADVHLTIATAAEGEAEKARAAAGAATGRVLDTAAVDAVLSAADDVDASAIALRARVTEAAKIAAGPAAVDDWKWSELREATTKAQAFTLDDERTRSQTAGTSLASSLVTLTEATAAWEAEQARLAAEKAERERLAAETAERERAAAERKASEQAAAVRAKPAPSAPSGSRSPSAAPSRGAQPAPSAQAPAPASKRAIADGVFARFGFSNVVYDSGASQGHYGATDLDNQVIYLQLSLIPTDRVASVAIHEFMHILQAREIGGYNATVAHFGSVRAMELDADRRARANGATWTHYR